MNVSLVANLSRNMENPIPDTQAPDNIHTDANLSQNMENPIPNSQALDNSHTDATWNLENPHLTDICQRLEFNVLPDVPAQCCSDNKAPHKKSRCACLVLFRQQSTTQMCLPSVVQTTKHNPENPKCT